MIYNFGPGERRRRNPERGGSGVGLDTGVTVKDQFVKWGKDVPQTKVVAHTPGAYSANIGCMLRAVLTHVRDTASQVSQYWTT